MSFSVDQQMTAIYCFVDEFLKLHPARAQWRRSPHAQPQFSDAAVLTLALLQGVFAVASLKQTYRLMTRNWRAACPQLPSYKQWVTRLPHLLPQVGSLLASTCRHPLTAARLYLIDRLPIPLCQPIRHGGYGCCATREPTLATPAKAGSLALSCPCWAILVAG